MVVACPKCKTKLKIDEARLSPEGSRFKCPKCATVLLLKKPVEQAARTLDRTKILVAHSKPAVLEKAVAILQAQGYVVVTAADGIEVMVKALKEFPFLSIVEVALPKIYGFEICKRLKERAETKEMKIILIPAIHDRTKYRRDPVSLYGADEYIEEHDLQGQLMDKINRLLGIEGEKAEKPGQPEKAEKVAGEQKQPEPAPEPAVKAVTSPVDKVSADERIEKARRLARTIINDIYLYNTLKVDEAIRNDNFYAVFASEVREGQKLYDSRIAPEIRTIGNFYREAIENFISGKKKVLA